MAELPQLAARPIIRVFIDQIDVPTDRLRTLKPEQAAAIGAAIAADRQYDPISIARLPGQTGYVLVDGLHRLEGCRSAGLTDIEARVVEANRTSRLRQEAMSAWARADHDAFDKAAQVAAMVDLAKAGTVEPADGDEACVMITQALRWDLGVANDLGVSRETVMLYLRLSRNFDAAQRKILREKGIARDLMPLLRLAALPADQFAVAWGHIDTSEKPTIAEALALVAPGPVNKFDKQKAKVLEQARTWQPRQLSELINLLRQLHREITGGDAE